MPHQTFYLPYALIGVFVTLTIGQITATTVSSTTLNVTQFVETSSNANVAADLQTDSSITPESCSCATDSELQINKYKKGNCTTKSKKFRGKTWCYVNQPSNCADLENSTFLKEQKYSASACPTQGFCFNIISIIYTDMNYVEHN